MSRHLPLAVLRRTISTISAALILLLMPGCSDDPIAPPIASEIQGLAPSSSFAAGVREVAAGSLHACVLEQDATISCWGVNIRGETLAPEGEFTQISAGSHHTCAISAVDQSLNCWGYNAYGQASPPAGAWAAVSAGYFHTCALSATDGSISCWGYDSDGQATPPAGTFSQVDAGGYHTCAIATVDQRVSCWGLNNADQLNLAGQYSQITTGGYHTCGILLDDQSISCWGANSQGQAHPQEGTYRDIAAGDAHTCAVSTAGELSCWGSRMYSHTIPSAASYTAISATLEQSCALTTAGTPVCWLAGSPPGAGNLTKSDFVQISAAETFGCGIRREGHLSCWGFAPTLNDAANDTYIQVGTGRNHLCAVSATDGSVACWGLNASGEATPASGQWQQVSGGWLHTCAIAASDHSIGCWGGGTAGQLDAPAGAFSQLSAGDWHTCAIAEADSTLNCWGGNSSSSVPPPSGTFTHVGAGGSHTCAVSAVDRTVACWGANSHGQSDPPSGAFLEVSGGTWHTCGLRTDGNVECWGDNSRHQLEAYPGVYEDITARGFQTCGRQADGVVECWGDRATTTLSVEGNSPPIAHAGGPYEVVEGTSFTLDGSASSDADGDALTWSWGFGPLSAAEGVNPSRMYSDNGTHPVTLQVSDGKAFSEIATTTITVLNLPPVLGAIVPGTMEPVPLSAATVTVTAAYSDPGTSDRHSARIDWGDGSIADERGWVSGTFQARYAAGTHTYSTPGVYAITMTLRDDDGAEVTRSYEYVVVYDPSDGFVTGGGWIESPAGAFAADPSLSGRATFGFVSKYARGATRPSGNTEFQFQAGDLRFAGTGYDWLLIAGSRAKFKGYGTINGAGDYAFMVTALDGGTAAGGTADRFRIKIWDRATEVVVYDNQMGQDDDAYSATGIGGGSIVVHAK